MIKIKEIKIISIIFTVLFAVVKLFKAGQNSEKLKNLKQDNKNDKIKNKIDDIIDNANNDELSKLL